MTGDIRKHLDPTSLLVILVTLGLFATALFLKGFEHDLLLEGGVFLVSVKLILMAHRNSVVAQNLTERLEGIRSTLSRLESQGDGRRSTDPSPRADHPDAARRAHD